MMFCKEAEFQVGSVRHSLGDINMKMILTMIVIAAFSCALSAEDKFVSETLGFEISAPEVQQFSGVYQHSMFYLPAIDGFGANVNIQVQDFDGTLQEYEKISRDQFKELGLHVIASRISEGILTVEYGGKMSNYELHWYARATKKGAKIYLATATALETRWQAQGPILIKSVDSFKLK
jgi:hypothetical protein